MSGSESTMQENSGNGRLMKNKIKVYRAMQDLTQEDLAKAIGVTRQTILAIEKGKYIPSLDLAFRISRYFKVNIEEVFSYDERVRTIDID
ncbi:MAG: helix-turn-helix transcriptional regulator [Methanoregula sp.]|uniref:helix-turn-helix transcriptional regulator n=2 Tax=Methanoregula sp. TaxID=2052170 RepID=UPI003C5D8B18